MTTDAKPLKEDFSQSLAAPELHPETRERLTALLLGLQTEPAAHEWRFEIKDYAAAKALMELEPSQFRVLLLCMIEPLQRLQAQERDYTNPLCNHLGQWLVQAMRSKHCLDDDFLIQVAVRFSPDFQPEVRDLAKAYIGRLEKFHEKPGFSPSLKEHVANFHAAYSMLEKKYPERECKALLDRLAAMITTQTGESSNQLFDDLVGCKEWFIHLLPQMPRVEWPGKIEADMAAMGKAAGQAWRDLWKHAAMAMSSAPSQKWLGRARELVTAIGLDFGPRTAGWLELMIAGTPKGAMAFSDRNAPLVKGLLWACSLGKPEELSAAIGNMVQFGYVKIPGIGPRAMTVANAGLYALGQLGGQGIVQLSRLRARVKYNTGLDQIEKALTEAAKRQGISQDDLEEMAVPSYGLNDQGEASLRAGECLSVIRLTGARAVGMQWFNAEGKELRGAPADVKETYAQGLKDWQKQAAGITDALTGQASRLEGSYLSGRQWRYADWCDRFLQHPLMGWLGRRLIWVFEQPERTRHGLYRDGRLSDDTGEAIEGLIDDTRVRLWHPTDSGVDEVHRWRALLQQREIIQPFRQAFREVYILTPAELDAVTSSARFAGHILKQFPLASLCRERGWVYHLQGDWDGYNVPTRQLPRSDINVRLEIDFNEALNTEKGPTGVHLYVQTGHVRFNRPLTEIPPIFFSEIMRDVDLFVGVCSIGVDPALQGRIDHPALGRYLKASAEASLTDSAMIRRDILESLISKLAIAPRCRFEGKYLVVDGDLRGYKIHLGSGNILMTPNDQYLCIVPAGKKAAATSGLFLPFEGDAMLDVILSKALMLAADKKIKDESILRQIRTS